jgi:hypothetical protein
MYLLSYADSTELQKLKELFEMGFIQEEEYNRRRAQLIANMEEDSSSASKTNVQLNEEPNPTPTEPKPIPIEPKPTPTEPKPIPIEPKPTTKLPLSEVMRANKGLETSSSFFFSLCVRSQSTRFTSLYCSTEIARKMKEERDRTLQRGKNTDPKLTF